MTTTPDPLKLARDALQKLACLGNGDKPGNSTGNVIALTALAAIDALPVTKAFPLETVTRLPAERVTELFGRWVAARQQHPAPRGDALGMNEEFLLCLDAFDRQAEPSRSALDVEQLLRECVPGGSVCDPQQIADAIRAYCAALPASVLTGGSPEHMLQDQSRDLSRWLSNQPGARLHAAEAAAAIAPASVPSGEPAVRCELVESCRKCRHAVGRQSCALARRAIEGAGIPDWCPLPVYRATAPAAPTPAAVPAGWRIEATASGGHAVHAPSGAACIVRESEDSPRVVPAVVLAELCGDLLAARTPAPAVAPLLVRDLAASVKAQPLDVSKVLESLGYGKHSINMAVPADAIGAVETYFAARTQAQAAPAVAAAEPLRVAAQAVLDRWCSEKWEWARQGPTADLIQALADALAGKSAPVVAAPEPRTLTEAQIERHSMPASECPPDSAVMLVSSIRRLLGMAAAPTTQEPQQ